MKRPIMPIGARHRNSVFGFAVFLQISGFAQKIFALQKPVFLFCQIFFSDVSLSETLVTVSFSLVAEAICSCPNRAEGNKINVNKTNDSRIRLGKVIFVCLSDSVVSSGLSRMLRTTHNTNRPII